MSSACISESLEEAALDAANPPAITPALLTKILRSNPRKSEFLHRIDSGEFKSRSNAEGRRKKGEIDLDEEIIKRWNLDRAKLIIREMYFESEKGRRAAGANDLLERDRAELLSRGFDPTRQFAPTSVSQLPAQWVRQHRGDLVGSFPDAHRLWEHIILARAVNEARNDWLEHEMITMHRQIVPTLQHKKGVDYLVAWKEFDQKVARSVGKAFKAEQGPEWRRIAKERPELVAKSLYENQDPGDQYGTEARLFLIYLDSDPSAEDITRCIAAADLSEPLEVRFTDKDGNACTTEAFVIFIEKAE